MLRGSTEISRETVSGKKEIELLEENIPPHMHNSSITDGTNMKSVSSKKKSNSNNDGV